MNLKDFYFELPKALIAQSPLSDRSSSRLLVLDKKSGEIEHKSFKNIIDHINENDCLVLNETKVIPARLFCQKKETGAKIELLLLKRLECNVWETLVKPGKRLKTGDKLIFPKNYLEAEILGIAEDGKRIISFKYEGVFEEILDMYGEMPLPPYITERLEDKNRYQTIYAKNKGSAAAPTAGLHFTQDLLDTLINKGVKTARLTLHVGLGTFRPVKTDNIFEHKMHSEYYEVTKSSSDTINNAKKSGGRIIAVGTTSLRAMESCADENGILHPKADETSIFIYPGYSFKITDCLITNFHLPESTLMMLVSALAGRDNIMNAYINAIENKYRFFSFGDAMFIDDTK